MPNLETLTESDILGPVNNTSLRKARPYIKSVFEPVREGNTLTALVRGTRLYEVEMDVDEGGIHAHCSCPYHRDGYCKHIGAVLLKWTRSPEEFTVNAVSATNGSSLAMMSIEPPQTERPQEPPSWMTTTFAERQASERQRLIDWLREYKVPDLRKMAQLRGWTIKGNRKDDIIEQLLEQMIVPSDNAKAIYSLTEEQQQVLRATALLSDDDGLHADDMERILLSWGLYKDQQAIAKLSTQFMEQGLVLSGTVLQYRSGHKPDFLPSILAGHFPPLLEMVIPTSDDSDMEQIIDERRIAQPKTLIRALNQILLLLEQSPTPLRTPLPRPRLERFYDRLQDWDYEPDELVQARKNRQLGDQSDLLLTVPPPQRSLPDAALTRLAPIAGGRAGLEFIYAVLVTTNIIQPGSPVTIWPEARESFMALGESMQQALLARTYFQLGQWHELWEVVRMQPELKLKRRWNNAYLKPDSIDQIMVQVRNRVLRMLCHLPDNKWVELDRIRPLLNTLLPRIDQTLKRSPYTYGPQADSQPSWFLTRRDVPLRENDLQDWMLAQWNVIRYILTGPLHWLGLVDLGLKDGTLVAIRPRGLADLYWDRLEAPTMAEQAAKQAKQPTIQEEQIDYAPIQAEGDLIRLDPAAVKAQGHSLLSKITVLDKASADRFTYRLDVESVHATFESGVALSEIVADWEEHLFGEMPESILAQLTTWWDAYGQARIYENVTIIEFGDEHALSEMKAVTSLDRLLIAEIPPRLVLIPEDAVNQLAGELEKAGYTPKKV